MAHVGLLSEREIGTALTNGHLAFPPFALQTEWVRDPEAGFDGILHVQYPPHGREFTFAFEVQTYWAALDLQRFAGRAHRWQETRPNLLPLVILPYLSETHLAQLQEHRLGGLGEAELTEARFIAEKYGAHAQMVLTRKDLTDGFADPRSGGCHVIREQLRGQQGEADMTRSCTLLHELFG